MPEEYALPIEGYQQPIADPMGYALPVDMPAAQPIPASIPRVVINTAPELKPVSHDPFSDNRSAVQKLTGQFGERYQLWPEKVVREGLTGAGDVMTGQVPTWAIDPETGDVHTSPQMVEKAQAISALAGTGGLGGTGAEAGMALGAGPSLRPALKYKDRLYKGKEGQQHQDVIPNELYPEFQRMAMSGEDISHYNFGFVNDKGQFLNREKALEYGINTGLIDPQAGKFGALTSTLMADSSKPGTAIEAMAKTNAPAFYSAVEHNVNAIPQSKMSGDQWLSTLSNKPGVKPEELQWTGLQDFLMENKGKPVTKAQIEEHLAANKVELKEVAKGGNNDPYLSYMRDSQIAHELKTPADIDLAKKHNANFRETFSGMSDREILKLAREAEATKDIGDTKYHGYQLPGGENYREMLLTLPGKKDITSLLAKEKANSDRIIELRDQMRGTSGSNEIRAEIRDLQLKNDILAGSIKDARGKDYKSSHWDEPNILAHVRMNDRTMPVDTHYKVEGLSRDFKTREEAYAARDEAGLAGKSSVTEHQNKKSLHLEEIQSDWHQQGRDKGYKSNKSPTKDDIELKFKKSEVPEGHDASNYPGYWESFDKQGNMIGRHGGRLTEEQAMAEALGDLKHKATATVPDAPFKKSWHELALKRMIREAAEKGYDRLSWTPGEAQAARYDLSKQINKIHFQKTEKGEYLIGPEGHNGQEVPVNSGQPIAKDKLADFVGKEVAEKIIARADKPEAFKSFDKLPEGYDVIKDGKKYGVIEASQSHARPYHNRLFDTEKEAVDYAVKDLNAVKLYHHNKASNVLENVDLKIGGEGMKGFYDQIIPKALEKLGKEHGVKVKQHNVKDIRDYEIREDAYTRDTNLGKFVTSYNVYDKKSNSLMSQFKSKHDAEQYIAGRKAGEAEQKGTSLFYIDIPKSLKDHAMQKGFPLFAKGIPLPLMPVDHDPWKFTPVEGNPFEDKKK